MNRPVQAELGFDAPVPGAAAASLAAPVTGLPQGAGAHPAPAAAPSLQQADWTQWPVAPDWAALVQAHANSEPGRQLMAFLQQRLAAGAIVYPPQPLRALEWTSLAEVHLVILGQDPYHGPGQAEGLAFSVAPGVRLPPSLRNIFKERQRDLGLPIPAQGSLRDWARQGVLLLNTVLTVEEGQPASHAGQGWEVFTDAVLQAVARRPQACAYLLWGAHAQAKAPLIRAAADPARTLILQANHPSPLAALRPPQPFIGCGHFSQAQSWLAGQGVALTF